MVYIEGFLERKPIFYIALILLVYVVVDITFYVTVEDTLISYFFYDSQYINAIYMVVAFPAIITISLLLKAILFQSSPHRENIEARFLDTALELLIQELRLRAKRLRYMGNVILALLVLVLALGFTTFIGAEQSASIASSEAERLLRLQQREEQDLKEMLIIRRSLTENLGVSPNESSDIKSQIGLSEINNRIDRLKTTIDAISSRITEPTSGTDRDSPFNFALSLLSTKIGAVLLLVFGAQILVSLYRYTLKLASFSDSRADALIMCSEEDLNSVEFKDFFSSEQIEFVSKSESPTKQAMNMAKDILELVKEKDSSTK